MFEFIKFLKNYSEFIIFFVIFAVILFFFLKEFKLTSKNSWGVLLGLTALGGLFAFKAWRRKKLLEELAEREKALDELADKYKELKDKNKITEEAYNNAKSDLNRVRVDSGLAILKADAEHADKVIQIESEYQDISAEDLINKIKTMMQ